VDGYNDQEPLQGMTFRVMRAELMNCDVNYEDSPLRRSDTRNPRGIPRGNLGVARLGTSKRLAGVMKKREA